MRPSEIMASMAVAASHERESQIHFGYSFGIYVAEIGSNRLNSIIKEEYQGVAESYGLQSIDRKTKVQIDLAIYRAQGDYWANELAGGFGRNSKRNGLAGLAILRFLEGRAGVTMTQVYLGQLNASHARANMLKSRDHGENIRRNTC